MYVVSSFEFSVNLEMAITELEKKDIPREKILAIPLDKNSQKKRLFDSINYSDGVSIFDTSAILGTVLGLFGVIYGYNLRWGPIVWGIIGLFTGAIIGLIIDIIPKGKHRNTKGKNNHKSEIILIIQCIEGQVKMVEDILWDNLAIGVGRYDRITKRAD